MINTRCHLIRRRSELGNAKWLPLHPPSTLVCYSSRNRPLIDSLTRECAYLESQIAPAPPPQTTAPEDPPENAVRSEGLDFVLSDLRKQLDTHLTESSAKATFLKKALDAGNESLLLKHQQNKPYTEELSLARNLDSDFKSFGLISSETEIFLLVASNIPPHRGGGRKMSRGMT